MSGNRTNDPDLLKLPSRFTSVGGPLSKLKNFGLLAPLDSKLEQNLAEKLLGRKKWAESGLSEEYICKQVEKKGAKNSAGLWR